MDKNIFLIGFMGAGKSVVGRALAGRLKLEFVDLDSLIEAREKRAITEIFAKDGEAYFRKVEKQVVKEICQKQGFVVGCGGGVVLDEENLTNLKQCGSLIYLKATPEVILERTKNSRERPLLNVAEPQNKIAELLKLRAPFYAKADYTVDTSDLSVNEVVNKILEILK